MSLLALSDGEIAALTTSMRQIGVGTPGGAEALAIFHQLLYDEWLTGSLSGPLANIKVDEQNCFGMIEWSGARGGVAVSPTQQRDSRRLPRSNQQPKEYLRCAQCGPDPAARKASSDQGLLQHMGQKHEGQQLLPESVGQLRRLDRAACVVYGTIATLLPGNDCARQSSSWLSPSLAKRLHRCGICCSWTSLPCSRVWRLQVLS